MLRAVDRRGTPLRPIEVEQRLRACLGFRIALALSEAATPAFIFPSGGAVHVHVSPSILVAPDPVLDALSRFVHAPGDLEARSILLEFLDASPRGEPEDARGAIHDLATIFTAVNARFFEGHVTARIPALDQEWVPRGFVEFVVHHECLHAVIPARSIGGRRVFHPPEFRERERQYPDFWRWRRWEKENLGRFLGKPQSLPTQRDQTVDLGGFLGIV
jgi:hypothetical protein